MSSPIDAPPHIDALLSRLHQQSLDQEAAVKAPSAATRFVSSDLTDLTPTAAEVPFDDLMRDKFIALDAAKGVFTYNLLRATGATTVVEAGTSFGVSTIYLALAVARNAAAMGKEGRVIGTEKEEGKAAEARQYWRECGSEVEGVIDLRVGDLLETLKEGVAEVDCLLLDIWTPLALPTLKLVQPKMKKGAVVLADNTLTAAEGYKELLEYLRAPNSGFTNLTLPYDGGFEMSVYSPQ
ncbi:S-adenosyl-L-methionine-dependent methyltransferase [Mycena metata]|uniref:S-adenosyl-L-methionine-dependent methyltransferase n=1 Tax=Mycena metata TaxID=1033252 RepID=A0AAD7NBI5_9AGAR|nr:S-adenosyl-L-methionine-dependent methyltransferase [Mycena metata]